jgi:two-component sensor histidine kinase
VKEPSRAGRVDDEALVRWFAFDAALAAAIRPVHVIVEKMAEALAADCVFVGETVETAVDTAQTIACWKDGHMVENVTYPAASAPCEEMRPSSLVRHPLTGVGGAPLGHIGVVSRRRLTDKRRIRRVLASCAPRIAGEVERLRREQTHEAGVASETLHAASREQDLLESLRDEKTLLREVHHRIKNNLQVVASLLAMQTDATDNAVVRQALSDAASRISTIALIHAQLCEAPNGASVDMRAFVHELVANVRRTFVGPTEIVTRLRVDTLDLRLHLATPCGLLISELVTNAFRHAFVDVDRGVIDVILTSDGHDVTLTVRDDGVGLRHEEGEEKKGMGLRLVRLLATRQLRGRVSISARHGTEVVVRFPMSSPPRAMFRKSRASKHVSADRG